MSSDSASLPAASGAKKGETTGEDLSSGNKRTSKTWYLKEEHRWSFSAGLVQLLVQPSAAGRIHPSGYHTGSVITASDTFFLKPDPDFNASCPAELTRIPFQMTADFPSLLSAHVQGYVQLSCAWGSSECDVCSEAHGKETKVVMTGKSNEQGEWEDDSMTANYRVRAEAKRGGYRVTGDQADSSRPWLKQRLSKWTDGKERMRKLNSTLRGDLISFEITSLTSLDIVAEIKVEITLTECLGIGGGTGGTLRSVLESGKYSDVTLVASGGKRFPSHKVMLGSRSKVLATMFSHEGMLENQTKEITMDDTLPDVVREMLHYLYTDRITVSKPTHTAQIVELRDPPTIYEQGDAVKDESSLLGLLKVAEKYDIPVCVRSYNDFIQKVEDLASA